MTYVAEISSLGQRRESLAFSARSSGVGGCFRSDLLKPFPVLRRSQRAILSIDERLLTFATQVYRWFIGSGSARVLNSARSRIVHHASPQERRRRANQD